MDEMLGEKVEEMGEGGQRGRKENKTGKGMRQVGD